MALPGAQPDWRNDERERRKEVYVTLKTIDNRKLQESSRDADVVGKEMAVQNLPGTQKDRTMRD
jgi:hypothetical protein